LRTFNITILNLLNHTSGLPDVHNYHWGNNNQSEKSLEDYILSLNLKLKSEPSTQYIYSNLGYNILGYIIEKLTNTSFDNYLKENILNAYGMNSSDFRYFKIPDSLKTSPHSKHWITGKIYERKTYPYTREHAPSSTLNSSATDLCKWMISFMKLLDSGNSENVFAEMTEPGFSAYPHIGLGFQLSKLESRKAIGHYGGDKGFRSYLLMIPEEKIGLVLLANCDYEEDFRQEIIHQIAKRMLTCGNF
jgi:CubicO group peptidase (beta-lactamase class C family)